LEDAVSVVHRQKPQSWFERRVQLEVRDPAPFESAESFWRVMAQAATIVMAALLFGAFLFLARSLFLPVLCAVIVGMTFGPVVGWAIRRGVPGWLAALLIVLLLICVMNLAVMTLAQPISELIGRAQELGSAIKDKLHILDRPLAALYELQTALGMGRTGTGVEVAPARVLEGILTVLTPAAVQLVMQLVLFFGTLFFFILGRTGIRAYAVNWFSSREARLRALKILNDIETNLSGYLIVVTGINLALGVVATAMAYLMGLPAPLLWGALAFGLNYIPYVGPGIMYVLFFIIGLLTFPTLTGALLPPGVYMAITLVEGQFLTPLIIGRAVLQVHPLTIFLAIAFWAWLWGPVGAFVATPILIVAHVALNHLYPQQRADIPG
jgi:predicted PurR-regulated permease PerM